MTSNAASTTAPTTRPLDTVVLDIDGTLVDSNYQHALAWARAFAAAGRDVAVWRVHRAIGMGGDRLVPHLIGEEGEAELGDRIRKLWEREVDRLLDETTLLPHARDLLDRLDEARVKVVLASSGKPEHVRRALDLLGERDESASAIDHVASSGDAATKPAPDLIDKALAEVGGAEAVVIGDSVWDAQAAKRAGTRMIGVRTGGFGADELREAGADLVVDDLAGVIEACAPLLPGR